jgi:hypothetical protein
MIAAGRGATPDVLRHVSRTRNPNAKIFAALMTLYKVRSRYQVEQIE